MMSAQNRTATHVDCHDLSAILRDLAAYLSESELLSAFESRCGALLRVAGVALQVCDGEAAAADEKPLLDLTLKFNNQTRHLLLQPTLPGLSDQGRNALLDAITVSLGDFYARILAEATTPDPPASAPTPTTASTIPPAPTVAIPDDLVSAFAHKMRNNLSAMMTAAGQLGDTGLIDTNPDTTMLIGVVESAAEAQRRLIDRFVMLSRPVVVRLMRFEVTPLLRAVMQRYAAVNGNHLELNGLEREVVIETDRALYQVILSEMIDNGLEASLRHAIVLDAVVRDQHFELTFRNDCAPLPPYVVDNMLKPFFTTKTGHAGLGLPIALHYARLLGGTLRHRCGREDAEFTIAVPLSNEELIR